jgi:hypothetical protein
LGRSVCLAQLRSDHARPGATVRVLLPDGSVATAVVTDGPALDGGVSAQVQQMRL